MTGNSLENSFEFINVKKAQYNRERKNSNINTSRRNPAGRNLRNDRRNSYGYSAAAVKRSNYYTNTAVSDIDPLSNVLGQVGEAVNEKRRQIRREKASTPIVIRNKVKAKPFPVSFVFYALILTVTFMFIAYNYSVVNDISYETTKLEAEIRTQKQENERLTVALEKRNDLSYIEDVAVNKLGMVKSTDVVKQYVSLSGNDKVEVSENNSGRMSLGTTLNGLVKSAGKIFN